jgi:hypothetical protein
MSNKFANIRTFNGHDITVSKTIDGRTILNYDKGLRERATLIVRELVKAPKTARELLAAMQEIHPSYKNSDLKSAFNHLKNAGLLWQEGVGNATIYSLGQNAKKRWADYKSK